MRLALLIVIFLYGCGRQQDPLVAQMKLRNMQSHTFVGYDAKKVTKEIIAILQDEGFMIKNANLEIGLLTAEHDTDIEKFSSKFWSYVFSGSNARWKKHSLVEMTSSVTEEIGKIKVRINFVVRVFDNLGRVLDVHQIDDTKTYTEFFTKVQNGLLAH